MNCVFGKRKRLFVFVLVMFLLCLMPGSALAERLSIKVPKANIRSGPGTKYEIIWQVGIYYPVQIIKKSGHWYQFSDYEGDAGWISDKLLGKQATVITVKNKCNVRSGPATKYPVIFTTEKGVAFKVLKKQGKWIKIQHPDGDQGWIYKTLVW